MLLQILVGMEEYTGYYCVFAYNLPSHHYKIHNPRRHRSLYEPNNPLKNCQDQCTSIRLNQFANAFKNLTLQPKIYKIQLVEILNVNDYSHRMNFANHILQRFALYQNILFGDEANFHLNGMQTSVIAATGPMKIQDRNM